MQKKIHLSMTLLITALLMLSACTLTGEALVSAQDPAQKEPPPTTTPLPPPPQVAYVPVESDDPAPIVVSHLPRRGEQPAPTTPLTIKFDRPMAQNTLEQAFTLQQASETPQPIIGELAWLDERTMRFTPTEPLAYHTTYDAILTQDVTDSSGLPLAEPFTMRFQTVGYLEVSQVIPADESTDIETDATITVMFNRPVVPLATLAEAENFPQPLTFSPPIEGAGEWLNTSIYLFTPTEPLAGGTNYTAQVSADLQDVTETTRLADEFTWQFTTQPPEVVFTSPTDNETLVDVDGAIQITFNQPIDLQSAQDHVQLAADSLFSGLFETPVTGEFTVNEATLTFTPTEQLAFETSYQVTVDKGITAVAGGEGSRDSYNFTFTTVPLPKIIATTPTDGETEAYPYGSFRVQFNTPINPKTVMPHISMEPPLPITPTQIYTYYSEWDNSFEIMFNSQPSTDYQVTITPGIEDPYGNQTNDDMVVDFTTGPLQPRYNLLVPGMFGMYDAALPAKLIANYTNINQLELKLYQLAETEINRPGYEWYDYQPSSADLEREWTERLETPLNKQSFHTIDLAEDGGALEQGLYYLTIDAPQLAEYYNREQRHVLVVSELGLTLKSGEQDALVWATTLADGNPLVDLTFEFYDDGQRLGTATTDADGIARLEINRRQNRNNLVAVVKDGPFSAVAEDWNSGINPYEFGLDLAYNLPEYNVHLYTDRAIYRPGQIVYFKGVVRKETDVNFSLPDLGEVSVTIMDATYTPILEEAFPLNENATFNGEIELPEGASLGRYTLAVDFLNQYFEQSFDVAAYRPPEFEVTVETESTEYQREADIAATAKVSYFFGGPLAQAEVAWNVSTTAYQFAPPQLGTYKFYDTDDPYTCFDCWWWQPPTFPNIILEGTGTTDSNGELTIDLNGAELNELLERGSHNLILEATATGPDNQFISGRTKVVIHKGDYYIGLSPQEYVADAQEETAVDLITVDWVGERLSNKDITVQIIRHEWVNKFIENESGGGYWSYETKKTLIDEVEVTTDNQGEAVARFTPPQGGNYHIVAQDTATLAQPDEDSADEFARSAIRSSIFIWVAGDDQVSWRRENHDRITLISDKIEYSPGETAEILIPSPFEGDHLALVTVERGRLIEHTVVEMTSSSYIYSLPITEQYAPNIYISVVLMQGRTQGDDTSSPTVADYKMGILPLDVTPIAQKLTINLTPETELAEPGQEITYQLNVSDATGNPVSAEFSLDLVDKAVLSLMPRQPEAIVETFYKRRGLGINTASNLSVSVNRMLQEVVEDLELEEQSFFAPTSTEEAQLEGAMSVTSANNQARAKEESIASFDEMDDMMADTEETALAAPAPAALPEDISVRAEFSDTAFWEPSIVTDEQGQADVTFRLPDNLTTWVMRGVALTAKTIVGEGTSELVSTKPLLIRPVAPRFFVVDDRADLAANISNNTNTELTTEVTLSAIGVTINPNTPPVQTVTIPAQGEIKVTWDVTVADVEYAELTFAAESRDYQDAAKPRLTTGPDGTLVVHRYTAPDVVGTAGQLTEAGSRTEVIALPVLADPETGKIGGYDDRRGEVTVQLDPSLAASMQDGLKYLEHYPYECTEQTVSRFLPNVLTFDAIQQLGLDNPELEATLPDLVAEGLSKLYTDQKADGGWGWWSDNQKSNVYVTAYVVFALTKAQQAGFEVKAEVLTNGQTYLLDNLKNQLDSTSEANQQAFILYTLAEDNQAPPSLLDMLFDQREKLSHYGRAYLAMALALADEQANQTRLDTLLSDINNAAILSATGAHWEEQYRDWWSMNTDTRSTAIILDALAKLDPDNDLNPNVVRWLMVARQGGIWETTQETAWALISLTDWMVETGELNAEYDYLTTLNEASLTEAKVTQETVQTSNSIQIPIDELNADEGNRLTVSRTEGPGRLYYSAHAKIYLPVPDLQPQDRGIVVSRRYTLESCDYVKSRNECPEVREVKLGDVIRVDLTIIAPNDLYYLVVEDPLPAGAEAIDYGLATSSLHAMEPTVLPIWSIEDDASYRPYYYGWWRWYTRSELRDDKVVLFADVLPKGSYEYSYTMRATLPGDYQVIPTLATQFYFPEVFGRSRGRLLSIGQ